MLSTKEYVLILGAGQTGISAAKFLKNNNFKIFDTRKLKELSLEIQKNKLISKNLILENELDFKLISYAICFGYRYGLYKLKFYLLHKSLIIS